MDLAYSAEHETFRSEVRGFLDAHRAQFPKRSGDGRPNAETIAWQKLLIEHGYAARTIPRIYGGYGAAPLALLWVAALAVLVVAAARAASRPVTAVS